MILPKKESENQKVSHPLLEEKGVMLFVKREDLLHKHISGNKYRKLFYNLIDAKRKRYKRILTFGGAFSNHIAATATAGRAFGFETIGVIRGNELAGRIKEVITENPTLAFAHRQGMRFYFVDRTTYRLKETADFIENLKQRFGHFYLVPQGGTNELAVKGAQEILNENDAEFDYIACAVGTGGTIAGIINASMPRQKVLGFPALKENFLQHDIRKYVRKNNWTLIRDYHFGGFAKINEALITFVNRFYRQTGIPLDPVYTGKMLYGLFDMIEKGHFTRETKILAVHTGGLQGIDGMNFRLQKKGLPLLKLPVHYAGK